MIIKFACNYKIQLARGYVLSVCIGVCKRQGEQGVNRAHADQRKPKCVSLWDRWPGSTHKRGATERVALHTGGWLVCIYIYIYSYIRICIFIIVSFANRRISRWSLMTRWQRNTSALHARDMSFSSIIFLYSSVSFRCYFRGEKA